MTDEKQKDIHDELDFVFRQMGLSQKEFAEHVEKNFAPKDVAELVGIMSCYSPLLETANTIHKYMLYMHTQGSVSLPKEYKDAIELWMTNYKGIKEKMNAFNAKETYH